MTTIRLMLTAAVVAGSAQALSAQSWPAPSPAPAPPATLTAQAAPADRAAGPGMDTPAQRKMAMAQQKITREPKHFHGYNELALALTQRARETADPRFYLQADEAVKTSLALSPDNFEALKVRTWAMLGQHRFAEALTLATTLNKKVPDDLMVYGMLTDANIELGKYDDAEKSAQWMLDLRPGNIPALTRAAYLRELFGDIEGAIDLMQQAFTRMPYQETRRPRVGAHADRTPGTRARQARHGGTGARAGARALPQLPLRARPVGRRAHRAAAAPRGGRPAAAALHRGAASRESLRAGRSAGARRAHGARRQRATPRSKRARGPR